MSGKVFSCMVRGISGYLVEVEVSIVSGISAFSIIGLGDVAIQEAKERIRSAIKNCNVSYPQQKKIINLAPASFKKKGPMFDLAMAIGLLAASGQIEISDLANVILVGELALDGSLRPINGALSIASFTKENGFKTLILPEQNAEEACLIDGIEILPAAHLQNVIDHFQGEKLISPKIKSKKNFQNKFPEASISMIKGQLQAKKALLISAAGGHHLLLYGPPGVGKTVLAKSLRWLLPPLSYSEYVETLQIYSILGSLEYSGLSPFTRPFRSIHHTASMVSLIGGGPNLRPGEVSKAHNGVLFMDEIAEFPRSVLETLRQPMEEKFITINRSTGNATFPCAFTLVASMNPCPCGHYGDELKSCICSTTAIQKYRKKLSGPIFDRLDLTVRLSREKHKINFQQDEKIVEESTENLDELRSKVSKAREIQRKRYKEEKFFTNSGLNGVNIKKYIRISSEIESLIDQIATKFNFSTRSYLHLLKTALTLSDIDGTQIQKNHVLEAMHFRSVKDIF